MDNQTIYDTGISREFVHKLCEGMSFIASEMTHLPNSPNYRENLKYLEKIVFEAAKKKMYLARLLGKVIEPEHGEWTMTNKKIIPPPPK